MPMVNVSERIYREIARTIDPEESIGEYVNKTLATALKLKPEQKKNEK